MRVLWPHNFNPEKRSAGVFMFAAARGLRALSVEVELCYLGNLRSIKALQRARRMLLDTAPAFDLVHAQYGSACALAAAEIRGCPKVVSLRGNDWNLHRGDVNFMALHTRLALWMTVRSLPRYDLVLTVSKRMKREVRSRFPETAVATLPSPVDLELFRPRDRAEARAAIGFGGHTEPWVLYNNLRLDDPIKRSWLAYAAVERVRRVHPDLRLHVANDVPHEQMPLHVAACDVVLCTSETEGWPNAIKEALACNVPFVSTDVGDLHEIAAVEPSCKVVDSDPDSVAAGVCEVLAERARPALRRFADPMGLRETSEALKAIYEEVVAASRGRACAVF